MGENSLHGATFLAGNRQSRPLGIWPDKQSAAWSTARALIRFFFFIAFSERNPRQEEKGCDFAVMEWCDLASGWRLQRRVNSRDSGNCSPYESGPGHLAVLDLASATRELICAAIALKGAVQPSGFATRARRCYARCRRGKQGGFLLLLRVRFGDALITLLCEAGIFEAPVHYDELDPQPSILTQDAPLGLKSPATNQR